MKFGGPSHWTSSFASARFTAVVCGIWASRTASSASSVPATAARTSPESESGGIFAKLEGSASGATYVQPAFVARVFDRNQRPDRST